MLHVEFWMASHFPIIMDGEADHTSRLSPAKNPSIFKNVTFLTFGVASPPRATASPHSPLSFFFESQFLVRLIIIRAHRDEGIGPPARPGPDFASLNATGLSCPRGASAAESASESRSRRTVVWASVRRLAPYGAKCGN